MTPEDQPDRTMVVWQTKDKYLQLEAYPHAALMPSFLDICFVALVIIESQRELGDSVEQA